MAGKFSTLTRCWGRSGLGLMSGSRTWSSAWRRWPGNGMWPQDKRDELMEFVELWLLLWDVKMDRIIDAGLLVGLVREVS
jgi:hypothetical protein